MWKRGGRGYDVVSSTNAVPRRIVRLSTDRDRLMPLRKTEAFLSKDLNFPQGFSWYAIVGQTRPANFTPPAGSVAIFLPDDFHYLGDGDVLRLEQDKGEITALFQNAARHNSFLLTERCNNYCLMCSQPPKDVQDDWIVKDIMDAVPLINRDTQGIVLTGGEPTLLGDRLVSLVRQFKSYLPFTGLHVLTNGRSFTDLDYAKKFTAVDHPDLMFGIPIYSDIPDIHDYVVQADGAFDETVRGVLNLKRAGLKVEIRVVIHKQTYARLPELARFLARNLTFVDQVVLMGLEITGFTRANLDSLWIDPLEYQPQLLEAVKILEANRMKVAVYNHQLCITDKELWRFAKQSISDWKNEYMPECEGCGVKKDCAGFFSSAKLRYSDHIKAI